MKIRLNIPERYAAKTQLPRLLYGQEELHIFPEGFLRSAEELDLLLKLSEGIEGTVIAGYRDGPWERAVCIERGRVADEYTKCVLTAAEREKKRPGEQIRCLNSSMGKIAVPICYEIHFPEVCRVMALENPRLMVNIIGTGMYHQRQYGQWRALARARAIENELPVAGCCHYCGEIPLAFAFDENGDQLLEVKSEGGGFTVEIPQSGKPIGYMKDRRPELFTPLAASGET